MYAHRASICTRTRTNTEALAGSVFHVCNTYNRRKWCFSTPKNDSTYGNHQIAACRARRPPQAACRGRMWSVYKRLELICKLFVALQGE